MLQSARAAIEGLRAQPLLLALVLVNVVFLAAYTLMLREIATAVERRDQVIENLATKCVKEDR